MAKLKCKICHKEYDLEDFDPRYEPVTRMIEKGICFSCAHWDNNYDMDHSDERLGRGIPVVVSKLYGPTAQVNPRAHWFLPFYTIGRNMNCTVHPLDRFQPTYRVLFMDGRLYTVNNLWHQGEIPPAWYDKFEVNAKLISNQEALLLIARKDTKVAEDLTHYLISKEGLDIIFSKSVKKEV